MFKIRNYDDLRLAYMILELDKEHGERRREHSDNLKRKIRHFIREEDCKKACISMVKDNGIDGYTYKQILPKWVFATIKEAEQYFMECIYIESFNSAYDCTDKAFTAWYKIFDVGENFVLYHHISYDV